MDPNQLNGSKPNVCWHTGNNATSVSSGRRCHISLLSSTSVFTFYFPLATSNLKGSHRQFASFKPWVEAHCTWMLWGRDCFIQVLNIAKHTLSQELRAVLFSSVWLSVFKDPAFAPLNLTCNNLSPLRRKTFLCADGSTAKITICHLDSPLISCPLE